LGRANGDVAQSVERLVEDQGVSGSIPLITTTSFHREVPDEVAAELRRWVRNIPKYGPLGVVQLVERGVWDAQVVGSSPTA
tara:strand:- start:21371 stop:21613 length:243 start_codon:yes stop_codon:yes gene_type:complete